MNKFEEFISGAMTAVVVAVVWFVPRIMFTLAVTSIVWPVVLHSAPNSSPLELYLSVMWVVFGTMVMTEWLSRPSRSKMQ